MPKDGINETILLHNASIGFQWRGLEGAAVGPKFDLQS
jgi:hypothetical protein